MTRDEYNKLFHKLELNLVAFKRLMDCDEEVLKLVNAAIAAEQREVEIEFKEWIHPHMGLVPVDPKTPLILKAYIREKNT